MNDNNIDKLFLKYNEALKILKVKFKKLYKDSLSLGEENPIGHIKSRIKSKKSTQNKLKNKNNLAFTAQNIEENLNDVAGIRIVCPFLSDIIRIINYVNNDPDIKILKVKNYIKNPKKSGYSSYHMIVSVPVLVDGIPEYVKAEIQIRTMAMDVIASLDHKIRYKKEDNLSKEVEESLDDITHFVNMIDIDLDNFIQERRKHPLKQIKSKSLDALSKDQAFISLIEKHIIALNKVEETIRLIKDEYISNEKINPIEHVNSRIKPIDSIISKLEAKNQAITIENIEKYINDMGAITIVCSFLSDVQEIINKINNCQDFIVLDKQDYITNPKDCGYSSYHFVVTIPIEINQQTTYIKTEIQVRTIIMDFWANVEHILCYKKEVDTKTKEEMKRIANILSMVDPEMDKLAKLSSSQINKSSVKKRIRTK